MKCFCRSDDGRIAIERPTGWGTYDFQCPNCSRWVRKGLITKEQRIAFALKQIRGQTIVQPRFYGGATLRRSRQGAESFGAEIDGEKLMVSSSNFDDGSMIVSVGTTDFNNYGDSDFMEMMINKDGKIDYFTLPTGKDDYQRMYKIKPSHYGRMKTQNETNESAGGDFIRTDGDGKYGTSFGAELSHEDKATRIYEDIQQNINNPETVRFYYELFYGEPPAEDYEGDMALDVIEAVQQNLNGKEFVDYMYGEMYNAESFGAESDRDDTEYLEAMQGLITNFEDSFCPSCSWGLDKHTIVNFNGMPFAYCEKGDSPYMNAESFGAELLDYPHPMSDRQKHRISKLGGRIEKSMNRSDASRYIKSLMADPLHAETQALDCSTCQGWGWNEDLNMVCDADGCIGGWVVPKKPSLLERGLELGAGVGMGMASVAIVFGLLGGTVGLAAEELKKRRD